MVAFELSVSSHSGRAACNTIAAMIDIMPVEVIANLQQLSQSIIVLSRKEREAGSNDVR
jgi:hypothetical protein